MKWAVVFTSIVGSALAMGLHPMLYGATTAMLAGGGRFAARLACLLGGLAFGATAMFALLHIVNPTTYIDTLRGDLDHAALNRWVDLYSGIALLVIAALVLWWRLASPVLEPKPHKRPNLSAAAYSYFGIGISCAVVGLTTWPLMYLVTRTVTAASEHAAIRGGMFLVFLIALVAPFVVLAWLWTRNPVVAGRISAVYTRALRYDYRGILAVLCAGAGLVLIALAALRLA
ncbi:hypothetical protein [Microbacterium sp. H1-D42]|uniref:hypothetical protein n=1 Tax=Microbacterium sp. H1-D42 TaxID=2925844 RepID=UPI001F534582|nr:hypothetical protein [Microbacterium sp. H1-D42]UNK71322.1 hypothetical protein MNR00_02375 [Microbacterium sp. H1-D42]